ncbi:hypothetical protein E2C01_029253 [Portunus trituberculatus]|uniref:Uncharacterized protein n=1 Tax=Portunus trituberculatus TaxID=210409 RepID=A0A5B7ERD9_PORTR|nr:hypothetical protein [Portunus trituberculatus]
MAWMTVTSSLCSSNTNTTVTRGTTENSATCNGEMVKKRLSTTDGVNYDSSKRVDMGMARYASNR